MTRMLESMATPAAGHEIRAADTTPKPSVSTAVRLNVNGIEHKLNLEPRVSLLDALREYLHLTGTKKGCDQGQCGSCTIHVNGRRVLSCLTLAVMHQGDMITTIEGLAQGEALSAVQAAFVHCDGLRCGFCTPGQVMSAAGLIREGHAHTPDEIRAENAAHAVLVCSTIANGRIRKFDSVAAEHAPGVVAVLSPFNAPRLKTARLRRHSKRAKPSEKRQLNLLQEPTVFYIVPEEDPQVNPIGVKSIGEIGIVGAPAAIANAVYHATGKRIRELPFTVEKLL